VDERSRQLASKSKGKIKNTGTFEFKNLNKHIAYLLGAYLSDGTIYANKRGWLQFTLEVIDEDFAQHVQEAINGVTRQAHKTIFVREALGKFYYKAYTGNQELCHWLKETTLDKAIIPGSVYKAEAVLQRHFLAGLMDGDGWLCVGRKVAWEPSGAMGLQFHLGFACTAPWICDVASMFRKLGVTVHGPRRQENGGIRPLYRLGFNKQSFLKAGMYFTIERKQKRLELYRRYTSARSKEQRRKMTESYLSRTSETKREPSAKADEVIVRSA